MTESEKMQEQQNESTDITEETELTSSEVDADKNSFEGETETTPQALDEPEVMQSEGESDNEHNDDSPNFENQTEEAIENPNGTGDSFKSDETDAVTLAENSQGEEKKPSTDAIKKLLSNKTVLIGVGIAVVALIVIGLFATHTICFHDWAEATCTEPETCNICGRTQGEPAGHNWKAATCTEPETCSVCGATQGSALGHSVSEWTVDTEASCTSTGLRHGKCTRCGETVQETIPKAKHTPGDWEVTEEAKISPSGTITPGKKARKCTVCGQVVETESFTPDISKSKMNALKKADSYLSWGAFSEQGLIEQLEFEGFSQEDAEWGVRYCGADWNEQAYKKANKYLSWGSFSHKGLVEQLVFEGFTYDQAEYGVSKTGL
ncbi:Ltp family lipoprotein [Parafannyhessea umbonata]|uniref:Host cell surface-exposed lipoprotein n=1 Tax=Parafannyhessea umbonata TaxID=604330 RepID=A0A1H9NSF0_9ACTN|nr:Ltp family lipoprotein [Parafannyhessea umbonata]SER38890.1 Host cell surface-exposed lipoprotein [Parafannyhessea umbonata]